MLGHKGQPNGRFGQKGVVHHGLIGGLHKGATPHMMKVTKEMVAKAGPKYGSLEKK
jgi:hypothetical protein